MSGDIGGEPKVARVEYCPEVWSAGDEARGPKPKVDGLVGVAGAAFWFSFWAIW